MEKFLACKFSKHSLYLLYVYELPDWQVEFAEEVQVYFQ